MKNVTYISTKLNNDFSHLGNGSLVAPIQWYANEHRTKFKTHGLKPKIWV